MNDDEVFVGFDGSDVDAIVEWTREQLAPVDLLDWQAEVIRKAWQTGAHPASETMEKVRRTLFISQPKQGGDIRSLWVDEIAGWERDIAARLEETPIYTPDRLERAREELSAHLAAHPVHVTVYPRGRV